MYTLMSVDDSNIIGNKIERSVLGSDMFRVIAKARNGNEAIDLYKKYKPDLITMDLTMPHMDGIECIQRLKAIEPSVKILVVSALSDRSTCIKALKLGAKGFVSKPFTPEDLVESLKQLAISSN